MFFTWFPCFILTKKNSGGLAQKQYKARAAEQQRPRHFLSSCSVSLVCSPLHRHRPAVSPTDSMSTFQDGGRKQKEIKACSGQICPFHMCMRAQSRLTLCDLMDCIPLGSSVHGILQARILVSIAISSSRGSS